MLLIAVMYCMTFVAYISVLNGLFLTCSVKDLDAMVFLLSKLSDDKLTTSVLSQNAKLYEMPMDRASIPAPGTKMTQEELSEVNVTAYKQTSIISFDSLLKARMCMCGCM